MQRKKLQKNCKRYYKKNYKYCQKLPKLSILIHKKEQRY